jgi:hypothetical protein
LSINEGYDGRVLLHCHAGCTVEEIVSKIGLEMRDLFQQDGSNNSKCKKGGEGGSTSSETTTTAQPRDEVTLEQYAEAKKLPVEFLKRLGLKDIFYIDQNAVRIPYYDENGNEGPVRFRLKLNKTEEGDGRFRWRKGSKLMLYGLWRLDAARQAGYAVRVEGESDCHTLWFHNVPAIGVPGASNWNDEWAHHFDGIPFIYDVVEPDKGGETWLKNLSESSLRDRVRLVHIIGAKDASELHCAGPDEFPQRWQAAIDKSMSWAEYAKAQAQADTSDSWAQCASLANQSSILDCFAETLQSCGVAGESRTAKLIYLAMTSRFLDRPVSVAVKGPSSGGKSYITEQVLAFFPQSAFYALSAMSERALAYST